MRPRRRGERARLLAVAQPQLSLSYSFEDYVRFETSAHDKHEFVSGLILAMAGGTLEHSALCSAVIVALGAQLAGRRCRVFESNARVRVQSSGNAYYPDASVVCGQLEIDREDARSLLNPVVIVEVLSPTTERYDRLDKLEDYQRISTLQHVVLLGHAAPQLEVWTRTASGWLHTLYEPGAQAPLSAIDCQLDVTALYRDPLRE
jgi:Uma2 family endonuclease